VSIRVVVADDQDIVRAGFSALLDTQPDLTVVGSAGDGAEAVRVCREQRPDVVLMDVRMPLMDGIEAARQLAAEDDGGPRVLMLTTFDLDEYVYDALSSGPAASYSRTLRPSACSTRCGWSPRATPCWLRRSPGGSSASSRGCAPGWRRVPSGCAS
jgi:DNA-binding NarL/FixJ family response regulator